MEANIGQFDPALLTGAPRIFEPTTVDDIIDLCAERFHVTPVGMLLRHRSQHVAFVRMIVMYLARELTDLSFPAIGAVLNRDHSTVIHGCNVIRRRMEREWEFRASMERLKEEMGQ